MKYSISTFVIGLLFYAVMPETQAADVAPCPPVIDGAGSDSQCGKPGSPSSSPDNDDEFGAMQISGGRCPNIPTSGPVATVGTAEALKSAIGAAKAGDVIAIADGSRDLNTITVNKAVHIRAQTLYGVTLSSDTKFVLTAGASISGFVRPHLADFFVEIRANNTRIACNRIATPAGKQSTVHSIFLPDDYAPLITAVDIDNNIWENMSWPSYEMAAIRFLDSFSGGAAGTKTWAGLWLHHNEASARSDNEGRWQYLGLGSQRLSDDLKTRAFDNVASLIENNHIDWGNTNDHEDMKASGIIYRYNCHEPETRQIHWRQSNDSLSYGNWWKGLPGSAQEYIGGTGHVHAFEYKRGSGSQPMWKFNTGQEHNDSNRDVAYPNVKDGLFKYNVGDNLGEFIQGMNLRTCDECGAVFADPFSNPWNNDVSHNVIRKSGAIRDYLAPTDAHTNETEFKAKNTISNNTKASNPHATTAACFVDGVVNWSGATSLDVSAYGPFRFRGQRITTIHAPSWFVN